MSGVIEAIRSGMKHRREIIRWMVDQGYDVSPDIVQSALYKLLYSGLIDRTGKNKNLAYFLLDNAGGPAPLADPESPYTLLRASLSDNG